MSLPLQLRAVADLDRNATPSSSEVVPITISREVLKVPRGMQGIEHRRWFSVGQPTHHEIPKLRSLSMVEGQIRREVMSEGALWQDESTRSAQALKWTLNRPLEIKMSDGLQRALKS
jgi:hypothetical protein